MIGDALLERCSHCGQPIPQERTIRIGSLEACPSEGRIRDHLYGLDLRTTPTMRSLLYCLMVAYPDAVNDEDFYRAIWCEKLPPHGIAHLRAMSAVRSQVSKARKEIHPDGPYIERVRGEGDRGGWRLVNPGAGEL